MNCESIVLLKDEYRNIDNYRKVLSIFNRIEGEIFPTTISKVTRNQKFVFRYDDMYAKRDGITLSNNEVIEVKDGQLIGFIAGKLHHMTSVELFYYAETDEEKKLAANTKIVFPYDADIRFEDIEKYDCDEEVTSKEYFDSDDHEQLSKIYNELINYEDYWNYNNMNFPINKSKSEEEFKEFVKSIV